MESVSPTLPGMRTSVVPQNRCCGHRRSSSLPVSPTSVSPSTNFEGTEHDSRRNEEKNFNLSGLVDTLRQICESLARPANSLLELLDYMNKNLENSTQGNNDDIKDEFSLQGKVQIALKKLNSIQGNFKHVLPHVEEVLSDYKVVKERTQSRDEMLKTLDKALRRSEEKSRSLLSELQDMRDENKCLREKAQQNESILRYLNKGKEGSSGEMRDNDEKHVEDGRSNRVNKNKTSRNKKSHSNGDLVMPNKNNLKENIRHLLKEETENEDLEAKLGHYQKNLRDYEKQLEEVVQLNKELVLKINERESEVMSLNRDLLKHQETLAIYEKGFKNLTKRNSELDASLREQKAKTIELREKLEDTEGYISCITDKVASYEVEMKYLKQQLRKRDEAKL